MEVSPEFLDLASFDHLVEDLNCISRLPLLAHVVAAQHLVVSHMAHPLKVVDDPFVEMITPVTEGMG